MIVFQQLPEYLAWANDILGVKFRPDPATTVWLTRLNADGSISAVVVFDGFRTYNCEVSVASDGRALWATKDFIRVCYRYAFNQMKMRRITAVVQDDNTASLRASSRLGHVEEGRLKHWFGEHDGVIMRMLREECKWL